MGRNVTLETSPTCTWHPFFVSVARNLELDGAYIKTLYHSVDIVYISIVTVYIKTQ